MFMPCANTLAATVMLPLICNSDRLLRLTLAQQDKMVCDKTHRASQKRPQVPADSYFRPKSISRCRAKAVSLALRS
jgi:hypothetical protein